MAKQTTLIEINGKYYPSTVEVADEPVIDNGTYKQKVVACIREKYDIDDELAIKRQEFTKPDEYKQFFDYCEECKLKFKEV